MSRFSWSLVLVSTACGPSLQTLHTDATRGRLPSSAALHTVVRAKVDAPPEVVWSVLADLEAWPAWHPVVTRVKSQGLAVGATFDWVANGSEIHSRLAVVDRPRTMGWTGSASVATAVHFWRLSPNATGGTALEVEEMMNGPLLSLFFPQARLDADVKAWVLDLKAESERRSTVSPKPIGASRVSAAPCSP
jgi:hypothetical protein